MAKEALPTQQLIEISDIKDGVLILKNGGLRRVLMVAGVNFDLKSEEEQNSLLYSFQSFLNSLSFSLQCLIHSRKLNVEEYLLRLQEREKIEPNELLKNQVSEYQAFIKTLVSQNAIMQKSFFVVVPYDPIQLTQAASSISSKILGIFGKKSESKAEQSGHQYSLNLEQLDQRTNQIMAGLQSIWLFSIPLNTQKNF